MNTLNLAYSGRDIAFSSTSENQSGIRSVPQLAHWSRIWNQLGSLRNLADDWDGLGADSINDEIIGLAERLIREFQYAACDSPPARLVATTSGGIVIEWQSLDEITEVEIDRGGSVTVLVNGVVSEYERPSFVDSESADIAITAADRSQTLSDDQSVAA